MSQVDDIARTAITGVKPARSGWGRTKCPFCVSRLGTSSSRASFAVYFPWGYFKCFRCAIKGVIGGWATEHKVEDFDNDAYHSVKAPAWFHKSGDPHVDEALACRVGVSYAEGRGFDMSTRHALGMGFAVSGKYESSLVIPHRDEKGEWWGFTARKWFTVCDQPYMYPEGMSRERMFNDQALQIDTEDPALWMEGVLDTAFYWPDGLGGLGKPIEEHVDVAKTTRRPICMVLDGDAWREGERFMMRLRLEGLTAGAVRMAPGRDPNDKIIDPVAVRRAAAESLTHPRAVRVQETRT